MTYQTFRFNPSLLRKCHLSFFRLSGVPSYAGATERTYNSFGFTLYSFLFATNSEIALP